MESLMVSCPEVIRKIVMQSAISHTSRRNTLSCHRALTATRTRMYNQTRLTISPIIATPFSKHNKER